MNLTDQQKSILTGLVNNRELWPLVQGMLRDQVQKFWDALRLTDIADEPRVAANHKVAVAAEAVCEDFIKDVETAVLEAMQVERESTTRELPDITKELLG